MHPTTIFTAIVALSGLLAASPPATAAPSGYTFTAINPPGEPLGYGIGINNLGQIVGSFADSAGGVHAFLDSGGQFTTIDPPGAGFSIAVAINNQAQILGNSDSIGNFVLDHGIYKPVSAPGFATGINDQGQIVGTVCDTVGCHAYVDTHGSITLINGPSGSDTFASAIDDSGQIVGNYDSSTGTHGFLYTRGIFISIDVPHGALTLANGINDQGQIVGNFTDSSGVIHGFLDTNGSFTRISVPGSLSTVAQSINELGQIVGFDDFGGVSGAFLATPANAAPEPSSLALITIGSVGLGLIGRLKRA